MADHAMIDRLRSFLSRRPALRRFIPALDVHQRFNELEGGYLAASVTLMAVLSVFPLIVVAAAVLGFISVGRADITSELIQGLGLPAGSDAAHQVRDMIRTAEDSRQAATIIGLIGLLWSGLGLVGALQHAYNAVWQVKGRGLKDRGIGLLWLAGAGILFLVSLGVTAGASFLPGPLAVLGIAAGLVLSFGLWLWSAMVLANRDVGWRSLVPGAIVGAVGLEVLKLIGAFYVPRAVASASALYGSVGLIFALLAWLFFFGRLIVYSAVTDVVLYERRRGTDHAEIEVPRISKADVTEATRAGRVEVA